MLFRDRASGVSWLLVCLGNPGDKYRDTRHNAGFLAADTLAGQQGLRITRARFKALTAPARLGGEKVLVMKPQTFMNLSGEAVQAAASFYKIPPERVLVIADDTSLPAGKLRVRPRGSAGGHNGLKNIIQHLGTEEFPRVKIGVGAPAPGWDMIDWVLGRPQGEERRAVEEAAQRAIQAAEELIRNGPEAAMNKYNG